MLKKKWRLTETVAGNRVEYRLNGILIEVGLFREGDPTLGATMAVIAAIRRHIGNANFGDGGLQEAREIWQGREKAVLVGEFVPCRLCGGRREHDLRTGEVGQCDTCFWECPYCGSYNGLPVNGEDRDGSTGYHSAETRCTVCTSRKV